jgi:hypothetical protein
LTTMLGISSRLPATAKDMADDGPGMDERTRYGDQEGVQVEEWSSKGE